MADVEPATAPVPEAPPPPVILRVWFPEDALPTLAEDEEPPPRKSLDAILSDIPRRLLNSAPTQNAKRLRASIVELKATLEELGEPKVRPEPDANSPLAIPSRFGPRSHARPLPADFSIRPSQEDDAEALEAKTAAETALAEQESALEAAEAAYDELVDALCTGEHTTREWVRVLNAYVDAGVREIIPGPAPSHAIVIPPAEEDGVPTVVTGDPHDVAFDTRAAFATEDARPGLAKSATSVASRDATFAAAEFLARAALEKGGVAVTPVYAPNVFLGWRRAAEDAEAWIDAQMASLGGLERLEHLAVSWADDSAPGVASCLAAIRALGGAETPKVARLTLDNATSASFRACRVQGVAVDAVAVPARVALTSVAARLVAEAREAKVDVVATDALRGGLVSENYLGAPPPTLATLRGTPAFEAMREIEASPGGWEAHQALLRALAATGLGVETAMLRRFADEGVRVVVETTLERGPAFDAEKIVGGESLAPTHKEAIDAALEEALGAGAAA